MEVGTLIRPGEVQILDRIGSGGSGEQQQRFSPPLQLLTPSFCLKHPGEVRRGIFQGTEVAVKQLLGIADDDERALLTREAQLMATLRHPNMALFLGACLVERDIFIVMEYYRRGSLQDVLRDHPNLSWEVR